MQDQQWIVVITGQPATGKSALAARLRARCGWPLLTKDSIKEVLFETLGDGDREWSRRLSAVSFALLFRLAEQIAIGTPVLVLEGNFRSPEHLGQLRQLAKTQEARLLLIDLRADAAVVQQRLRERAADATRHPGHLDRELATEVVIEAADRLSLPGPAPSTEAWLRRDTSVLDASILDEIASAVIATIEPHR